MSRFRRPTATVEAFQPDTYACRPPGAYHGPFKSAKGCMPFEIHYYDESKR